MVSDMYKATVKGLPVCGLCFWAHCLHVFGEMLDVVWEAWLWHLWHIFYDIFHNPFTWLCYLINPILELPETVWLLCHRRWRTWIMNSHAEYSLLCFTISRALCATYIKIIQYMGVSARYLVSDRTSTGVDWTGRDSETLREAYSLCTKR